MKPAQPEQQQQQQPEQKQVENNPPVKSGKLIVPTEFGETVQGARYQFTLVKYEEKIYIAIAGPVVWHLQDSKKGEMTLGYFMGKLGRFYKHDNITAQDAKKEMESFYAKFVSRSMAIDFPNITVYKVVWEGPITYAVRVPFTFKTKKKGGKEVTMNDIAIAYVQPGVFGETDKEGYFITSIWDASSDRK
jgi:hypothetical protein